MNEFLIILVATSLSGSLLFLLFYWLDKLLLREKLIHQYMVMKILLLFFFLPALVIPIYYLVDRQPEVVEMKGDDFTEWTLYEGNMYNIATKEWNVLTICLIGIWIVGLCYILIKNIRKDMAYIMTIDSLSELGEEEDIEKIKEEIQRELKITKKVEIRKTSLVDSPCIYGNKKPKIYFPKEQFTQEEMELLLRHELYHCKKRDNIFNMIMTIFWSVYWFNPIIWLFTSQFYNLCEIDCDRFVLSGKSKEIKEIYAELLLKIASNSTKPKYGLTSFKSQNTKFMKRRIYYIMKNTQKKKGMAIAMIGGLIALCPITTYAAAQGMTTLYDKALEPIPIVYDSEANKPAKEVKPYKEPEYVADVVIFQIDPKGTTAVNTYVAENGMAKSTDVYAKKGEEMNITLSGVNSSDRFKAEVTLNGTVKASKTSESGTIRLNYTAKETGNYIIVIKNLGSSRIKVSGSIDVD